jgi:hypothetical protein
VAGSDDAGDHHEEADHRPVGADYGSLHPVESRVDLTQAGIHSDFESADPLCEIVQALIGPG